MKLKNDDSVLIANHSIAVRLPKNDELPDDLFRIIEIIKVEDDSLQDEKNAEECARSLYLKLTKGARWIPDDGLPIGYVYYYEKSSDIVNIVSLYVYFLC